MTPTHIGVHAQFDRGGSQNLTIRGGGPKICKTGSIRGRVSQLFQNRVITGGSHETLRFDTEDGYFEWFFSGPHPPIGLEMA